MKLNVIKFSAKIVTGLMVSLPTVILAQETISTFQTIPFVDGAVLNTETYITMLYRLAIALAAFLVIFKIIIAGARLTVSDSVSGRSKAKEDISGALLGMLIILGAVTILNTINPNLTNLNFLNNAQPVIVNPRSGAANTTGAVQFKPGQTVTQAQITGSGQFEAYRQACEASGGVMTDDVGLGIFSAIPTEFYCE